MRRIRLRVLRIKMKPPRPAAWFVRTVLLVLAGVSIAVPSATAEGPSVTPFAFQWTGNPASPQPWAPDNWDLIVHARDARTWTDLDSVPAQHGPDCGPPPATHNVTSYADAVFICRNHMMTSFLPGGYGEIEFAPDHMADWSNGTAVISWHQSTFRTSARDWTDVLVTPFDENMVLPAHTSVDLSGRPRDAVHVEMSSHIPTTFQGLVINNFNGTDITTAGQELESVLTPSAVTRAHFQLEISRTHIRFGMPETGTWWIDRDVSPLKFTRGVVQLGHHSYTPDKECDPQPGVLSCTGDTWHWSDFSISSAIPFTMLRAQTGAGQFVTKDTAPVVEFPGAAPLDSHLRFAANGRISVSTDGGKKWVEARPQPSEENPGGGFVNGSFSSYWLPVPAGTRAVSFRGEDNAVGWWWVKDPAIWSSQPPSANSQAPAMPVTSPPQAAPGSVAQAPQVAGSQPNRGKPKSFPLTVVGSARLLLQERRVLAIELLIAAAVIAIGVIGLFWLRRRRFLPPGR